MDALIRALCFSLFLSQVATAADEEANIVVIGTRPESARSQNGPYSLYLSPQGTLRADADSWLRRESFLSQPQSGQPSPSQFSLPRFRNFDTTLSAVDIEGIPVHDPYTGVPFLTDLDLRAFQSVTIHRGIPTYDTPGLTPGGSLSFTLPRASRENQVGLVYGQPYGQAAYGRASGQSGDLGLSGQLYARDMQSRGDYRYYDDRSTPFNADDDRLATRTRNDQRDRLIFPFLRGNSGLVQWKGLFLRHDADSAFSQDITTDVGARRAQNFDEVTAWVVQVGPEQSWHIDWQHLHAQQERDLTSTGLLSSQYFSAEQQRDGLVAQKRSEWVSARASLSKVLGQVTLTGDHHDLLTLSREAWEANAGVHVGLEEQGPYAEAKVEQIEHLDQVTPYSATAAYTEPESRHARGRSYGVTLGENSWWGHPNVQVGQFDRMPTLLESYGDGISVVSVNELSAEHIKHWEVSLSEQWLTVLAVTGQLSYYRDTIEDKIVFIPGRSSFLQAQNLRHVDQSGFDATWDASGSVWGFMANYSRLDAKDRTFNSERIVPLAPQNTFVGEVRYRKAPWQGFVLSRYTSVVYRDLSNTVIIPAARTEDAGVSWQQSHVEVAVSLQNIFNVLSGPIHSGTASGRTARADYQGRPLPGRQWLSTIAYKF